MSASWPVRGLSWYDVKALSEAMDVYEGTEGGWLKIGFDELIGYCTRKRKSSLRQVWIELV